MKARREERGQWRRLETEATPTGLLRDSREWSPLSQRCLLSILLSQAGSWDVAAQIRCALGCGLLSDFFSLWMGVLILFEALQSCSQKLRKGVLDLLPNWQGMSRVGRQMPGADGTSGGKERGRSHLSGTGREKGFLWLGARTSQGEWLECSCARLVPASVAFFDSGYLN